MPLLSRGGVAATSRKVSRSILMTEADGVVLFKKWNSWPTPPRLRWLMWLRVFSYSAQPPLLS
jgi:hypothetical protein